MKNQNTSKISGQLCVVSDVHIRSEHDERYNMLCALLEHLDVKTFEYVILNGDIFEFFLGHRKYFQKKYQKLLDILNSLQKNGVQVYFVEGNHEFHVSDLNEETEIYCNRDLLLETKSGRKVAITHGDLLVPDWKYRTFRAFVKSAVIKILTVVIPSAVFNEISLVLAKTSRARDAYRELDHSNLLDSANAWIAQTNADIGIFGHFHVPFYIRNANQKVIASVSDWSKPSALILKNDQLIRLEYLGEQWIEVEPIQYPE